MKAVTDLRRDLIEAGQGHVVERLGRLDPAARERLQTQLLRLDLTLVRKLAGLLDAPPEPVGGSFEPPEVSATFPAL